MSNTSPVYIVGAKRTPIGAFLGALANVPAPHLGGIAVKAALEQAGVAPDQIQELYFGNVLSANLGQAPATQVALYSGLPDTTPCTLVNKVCASGTKSVMLGAMSILLGYNDLVVCGGMENMSMTPHYVQNYRNGNKYGSTELTDGIVRDGLQDVYSKLMMGNAGELAAEKYNITRAAQDEYAIRSYQLAAEIQKAGKFNDEIIAVQYGSGKSAINVSEDEEPSKVKYDKIPTLSPAFKKENGTITAANASKINDGAAAILLASEAAVKKHNLKPIAKIIGFADAARAPEWFTIAPADAIPIAAQRAGITVDAIDFFEINEAFSLVPIINQQLLKISADKVNVRGGAVALGHPIGCSGTRIVMSLANALRENNKKYGAVGICNGGGGASALILENVN
jgi:acetyl-CoA C-acetyltransferase